MTNEQIKSKIEQLGKLKQYRNKSQEELEDIAIKQLTREENKIEWIGLTKEEEKNANKIYNNYTEHHHIENFNDLEDLKTLVYNTLLENRIKIKIYDLTNQANPEIPSKFVLDSLTSLQKQNLDLKAKLGLNESQQEGWMQFWQRLCKKINNYAVEHRGLFLFKCPDLNCGKIVLLLRKVADYNTFDFRCFRGTFIYSETMMKLIDEKKISFKESADIFGVSEEYMRGMYEKIYIKEKDYKEIKSVAKEGNL